MTNPPTVTPPDPADGVPHDQAPAGRDVTRPTFQVQHTHLPALDAMSVYDALVGRHGRRRVFLLESLSGPKDDLKESIIGVLAPLRVEIRRSQVSIEGADALVDTVTRAWASAGVVTERDGRLYLTDDDHAWGVPALVADALGTPAEGDGAFGAGMFASYGYDAVRYVEQLPYTIEDAPGTADFSYTLVQSVVTVPADGSDAACEELLCDAYPASGIHETLTAAPASGPRRLAPARPVAHEPLSVRDEVEKPEYCEWVTAALEHIRVGNVYQVQLGHQITIRSDEEPEDVYGRMRELNPSPYMMLAPIGEVTVAGASPELFLRVADGLMTMRPIAGTIPKNVPGRTHEELKSDLLNNEKERAEHLMLVDLARNDFGRVCVPGSLEVTDLMIIEEYSHVFHIVSNVQAVRTPRATAGDVVKACFPAGTMTGAPKVSAMSIIESLEKSRRGLYAGAHGLVGFGGWMVLGLGIRMTVHQDGIYTLRASAGIVADSTPDGEWRESLAKLAGPYLAVTGKELA